MVSCVLCPVVPMMPEKVRSVLVLDHLNPSEIDIIKLLLKHDRVDTTEHDNMILHEMHQEIVVALKSCCLC